MFAASLLLTGPAQAGFHERYEEHIETLQSLDTISEGIDRRLAQLDNGESVLVADLLNELKNIGQTYNSLPTSSTIRDDFKRRMIEAGTTLHALHLKHKDEIGPNQPEKQRNALVRTEKRVNYASKLLYKYAYGLHQQSLSSYLRQSGCDVELPRTPDSVTTWPGVLQSIHKELLAVEKQARTTCFAPGDDPLVLSDELFYVPDSLSVEAGP